MSVINFAVMLILSGGGLVIGGVYFLFGPGWAMICSGILLVLFAVAMIRGA